MRSLHFFHPRYDAVIVAKHHANVRRLFAGTESRFEHSKSEAQ